jgi:hypothetical protein
LIALSVACAPKQRVPLDCVPEEVTIYVDQEALEDRPESIELSTNRPHKIYLKGPGYEPRLIVLEPGEDENGEPTLSPEQVCVKLIRVDVDRELTLEAEQSGEPDASEPR